MVTWLVGCLAALDNALKESPVSGPRNMSVYSCLEEANGNLCTKERKTERKSYIETAHADITHICDVRMQGADCSVLVSLAAWIFSVEIIVVEFSIATCSIRTTL